MTIRAGQVISEVIPEPEPPSPAGEQGDQCWQNFERIRAAVAEQERLKLRVAAEGFDD
ncbi:MAG: hypothetical protein AB7E77_06885 [Desulfobulbus sp.]